MLPGNSSIIMVEKCVYSCISLTSVDCMQHFDLQCLTGQLFVFDITDLK